MPYNGFKNDIFSLGQTLMTLVTGFTGYENDAENNNLLYRLIKCKLDIYWSFLEKAGIKTLSPEFKKLYFDMLSYFEIERTKIDEILNSDWMKEINDLNENQMNDLENEVRKEFERRENIILQEKTSKAEIKKESSDLGNMRSAGDNENNFNYNSKPYEIKNEKHFDNFIEIKTVLHPVILMNELINKLKDKYGNKCNIIINEKKLKFDIIFDKEKSKNEKYLKK